LINDVGARAAVEDGLGLLTSVFLRAIKMIIAPLVFSTLVSGVAGSGAPRTLGRIALRAMAWFLAASLISLGIGLCAAETLRPGVGLHLRAPPAEIPLAAPALTPETFLERVIPTSIADAMARNEVLQIVVFALFAGAAIAALGASAAPARDLVESVAAVMLKMTGYVIWLAPLAVFGAVSKAPAEQGGGVLSTYAFYVGSFYLGLTALWGAMLLSGAATLGVGSVVRLLKAVRQPALIALSTTSVEAAYPALLASLESFGVPNRIASLVLPLGYAFNLVGSMCYCIFAALFVAQAYDVALTTAQIGLLLLVLFVSSKGIANVPRASLVVVAATLPQFRIPEAGVLLILGVDHIVDMGRTATNAVGTAIAAATVSKWEVSSRERHGA
jgi:Na+/H+-dicarboxylate symporter